MDEAKAIRYYRIKAKVGHQGAGNFIVQNYYLRSRATLPEVWQRGVELLPGVKQILSIEEIGYEEYWRNRAKIERERRRREGPPYYTVLFTGVFALLTPNHVAVIQDIRGSFPPPLWELVVGINDDERADALKWYNVLTAEARARVLSAIKGVDRVVVFKTPDATGALQKVLPDVWVKGAEWRDKPLPEKPFCELIGCKIHFVGPYRHPHASEIATDIGLRYLQKISGRGEDHAGR